MMTPDQLAQNILDTLMNQRFEDWHDGKFEDFVTGEAGCAKRAEIIEDIKKLFHLPVSGTLVHGLGFVPTSQPNAISIHSESVERRVVLCKPGDEKPHIEALEKLGYTIKSSGVSKQAHPGTSRTAIDVEYRIVAEKPIL